MFLWFGCNLPEVQGGGAAEDHIDVHHAACHAACHAFKVGIPMSTESEATEPPQPTGPAAPLKRLRPFGSVSEAKATNTETMLQE